MRRILNNILFVLSMPLFCHSQEYIDCKFHEIKDSLIKSDLSNFVIANNTNNIKKDKSLKSRTFIFDKNEFYFNDFFQYSCFIKISNEGIDSCKSNKESHNYINSHKIEYIYVINQFEGEIPRFAFCDLSGFISNEDKNLSQNSNYNFYFNKRTSKFYIHIIAEESSSKYEVTFIIDGLKKNNGELSWNYIGRIIDPLK